MEKKYENSESTGSAKDRILGAAEQIFAEKGCDRLV